MNTINWTDSSPFSNKKGNSSFFFLWILFILCFVVSEVYAFAIPKTFSGIVKAERQKVVHISTSATVERPKSLDPFFDQFFPNIPKSRKQSALGSGFIISQDGYIVTNNHVIEKADKIQVVLFDEQKFKAKIVGLDPRSDLALIKIEAKGLPFVRFGNSNSLEIGDWVVAIGNPLGLSYSVTAGILSARGRDIFGGTAYGAFLQTDAAINPGNSGGPLFNIQGEVIGINTAIVAGGQGLGFAVPSNLAKKVIDQLKVYGKVKRGWFGVGIQNVDLELAESFGLPKGMRGVAITSVGADSPAEKAGLKQGDIIVEVEGKPVRKTTELQRAVGETAPGESIRVKIYRNQKPYIKKITVGTAPDSPQARGMKKKLDRFGFELTPVTADIKKKYGLKETKGLLVKDIDPSGVAWEAGIRTSDVIVKIDGTSVNTLNDFKKSLQKAKKKKKKKVTLWLLRRGELRFVPLPLVKS